jgi:hypothetical protein
MASGRSAAILILMTTNHTMNRSAWRFTRHYIEMVIAMFAGMIILGLPIEGALRAMGTSSSAIEDSAPAMMLLEMATIMTIPMVAWMRHHGHGWRPCNEMAASMFLPTFGAIILMWTGAIGFTMAMALEHAVMLPAMLIAMLLRIDEYACDHARHQQLAAGTPAAAEA